MGKVVKVAVVIGALVAVGAVAAIALDLKNKAC